MTTFEEEFPTLVRELLLPENTTEGMIAQGLLNPGEIGLRIKIIIQMKVAIRKSCLDKQRVREVLKKVPCFDACGEPGCCDRERTAYEAVEFIEKELGL